MNTILLQDARDCQNALAVLVTGLGQHTQPLNTCWCLQRKFVLR